MSTFSTPSAIGKFERTHDEIDEKSQSSQNVRLLDPISMQPPSSGENSPVTAPSTPRNSNHVPCTSTNTDTYRQDAECHAHWANHGGDITYDPNGIVAPSKADKQDENRQPLLVTAIHMDAEQGIDQGSSADPDLILIST